jgi:hypothetical protein
VEIYEEYEINRDDVSVDRQSPVCRVNCQLIALIGYPMVARANLLLRASGTSIVLPSSSGVPGLSFVVYISAIDKRFGKDGDR